MTAALITTVIAFVALIAALWVWSRRTGTYPSIDGMRGEQPLSANGADAAAQKIARQLFEEGYARGHTIRSFATLQSRIGDLTDIELRRVLTEMGAQKVRMADGHEAWKLPRKQAAG